MKEFMLFVVQSAQRIAMLSSKAFYSKSVHEFREFKDHFSTEKEYILPLDNQQTSLDESTQEKKR